MPTNRRFRFIAAIAVVVLVLASAPAASAAAFTPGNIVVYRVGTGAAGLAGTATAVFVDEYTPAGSLVQSIALPTSASLPQRALTSSGTSSSEGMMTRSNDGRYLMLPGYDAAPGATIAVAGVNRVVGRVDSTGALDTSTTEAGSAGNIRGATSTNGTAIWLVSSNNGARSTTFGASVAATQLSTTPTNLRTTAVFGGQLYVSSQSGAFRLSTVGSGTPTTSGQTTTNLPGFPTATGSPYNFFFADLSGAVAGVDTLYVADDGAGVGIQKYSLVAGSWTLNGSVTAAGVRGLTGIVENGTVVLFGATGGTAAAGGGSIYKLVDATGYNAAPTATASTIATAATNTAFRGIAWVPQASPTVLSINRASANPTSAATVNYTVVFSQMVTGVDSTDFALTTTGVTGASVGTVTGSGDTYTVTVNTGSGEGTIRLDVTDDDTIANEGAIKLGGTGASNGNFTAGQVYTIDHTPPTVTSIIGTDPTPTNLASVHYTVTFSENVTGVDSTDFSVSTTGVTGASVTGVTGSGSSYTVTVGTGSGDGTLRLDLVDNDSIADTAGNLLGGTGAGNGNFTGNTYTIDKTAPMVMSVTRVSGSPTNASSVDFTVTFSESVTGVDASDFTLTTSGVSGTSVTNVAGSGAIRTVSVNTGSGSGTIRLDVANDGTIKDLATNPLAAVFTGGEIYAVDRSAPSVLSINRASASPTNAQSVNFTVTFSETVTGVDASDFTLATTGVTGASITNVVAVGSSATVTVDTGSGDGTVGVNLTDDDTIVDGVGNPLGGSGTGNGNFTSQTYAIDKTGPLVSSITRVGGATTGAASVDFTVTFNESVTGVDSSDFTLTTTGVSGTSITNVAGSGTTYTVTVNTGSGNGTIRLDILGASATINDTAGNALTADFTTGEVYTIDKTAPVVASIIRADTNPTNAGTLHFTVTFSGGVNGVDTSDFALATSGVTGSISGVTGSGATYTVTVSSVVGNGMLRLDLIDNDSITAISNGAPLGGTGTGNGDFTTGETYNVDQILPTVTSITRVGPATTNAASVQFTVTFSEPVTGVGSGDFTVTASGPTGASVTGVTGSGASYTVTVGTGTGDGTIRLDILGASATINDTAGNALTADFTTGDVITIDKTAPSVQSIVLASADPSSAASVDFTVTFTESVTGVDSGDFTITAPTLTGTSLTNVAGSGATRTVTVATGSGNGSLRLDVTANGTILDGANNPLSGSFTTGQSYTMQGTPAAPANLTATPGNAHVALAWDAVGGATSYNVKRSTTSGTGYVTISSPATNAYDDTTAVNGTHYFYVVTAVGARGESANSNEANATPQAPPAAPTGLAATPGNNHVALAWNNTTNATSYNVKRSITTGTGYVTIASPATNSYDDTTAVNGTQYFYVVSGVGVGAEGANSSQVSATPAAAANTQGLVISQVYGGGGNSGSVFTNDFIEVFNKGSQTVSLTGWSVQYVSAAGTGTWSVTPLSGSIAPGHYYLVQEAAGAGGTTPLPTPDATGSIAIAATAGKTALVNTTTALTGGCPSGTMIADLVGFGSTASCFEGSGPTPAPSNANAVFRAMGGCTDTDNNAADFTAATAAPRNSASPTGNCSGFAVTGSASPSAVNAGDSSLLSATVTPGVSPASTGIAVTVNLTSIGGSASQTMYDDGSNGDVTPGDNVFHYNATVAPATTAGVKSLAVTVTDAQARTVGTTIALTINPTTVSTIAQAKVDANNDTVPDLLGQLVRIQGVVTSIDFRGGTGIEYYIQDATGGIDVFNSTTDFGPYSIGANVEVVGAIAQFNGLTEITPSTIIAASGLPAVTAQTVTLSQLADGVGEPLEGKLVTINNVTITSGAFPASGASGNVTINDGTGAGTMHIDSDTDIDGTTAPAGVFTLTGIVTQSDTTNPFNAGYQVLPRGLFDLTTQTPPIGSGSASPSSVAPNATTLLTIHVTPGQNPTSTGITVTANLTSIGGSASQSFFDDGTTGGDVSAGDGTYSYTATVGSATTLGAKSIPFTVTDAQARSTNGNISLNVQSANAPPAPTGLVATAGNLQVGLTWNASTGASGYNVYRGTAVGGPYPTTVATNVAPTNYTDTTVANGTHYYYVVTALSATNDESGPSNEANALPAAPPPVGSLGKIYFIDIGQGASTLIVSPTGKTLLVDGGPTGQGNAKVIPTLNTLGISTIDYTVLTHYHIDHDGGLAEVISAGRVSGTAYDNGDDPALIPPNFSTSPTSTYGTYAGYVSAINAHSATVARQVATPGTVIDLGGGMKATIMAQGGHLLSGGQVTIDSSDLNTESISMFVEYNNFDFLVSGDLTGGGSTDTAKTPDVETYVAQMVGDVDMVEFDHHGSTTANNRRFLKILKAEAAEAEAGFTNTFGHPNRETFNKYLNIPDTNGNTYAGTALPNPGSGPVAYQTDPSPTGDQRCTLQGYSGASTSNAGAGTLLLKTDGTTSFTIESFDDAGVRIPANAHVYALDATGAGVTTNFPPTAQTSIAPVIPLSTDTVTVSASVFDHEDAISSVTLNYAINGVAQAPAAMSFSGGGVYTATIAPQSDGTRVDYTVTAVAGGQSTSYSTGYFAGTTPISTLRVMDSLGSPLYWDYAARVQGVVTSGTGNFATGTNDDYLQDATGAINVWRTIQPSTPAVQTTTAGNIYSVAGLIGESAGRLRLEVTPPFVQPTTPYQITFVSASSVPAPLAKTIAQINAGPESLEAKLITISNCHITSGTIPSSPASIDGFLTISDGTGSFQLKIDHNTDIPGMATPSGTFTITGILQQDDFLRPFDSDYDIAPRNRVDLGGTSNTGPGLISIAAARIDVDGSGFSPGDYVPDLLNQTVHVQGVVTSINFRASNGSGIEYYIQDPTAGVDIFSTATTRSFNIGDNVDVIGTVKQFNGLTEFDPGATLANLTLLAPGTLPAVSPQIVTCSQLGDSGAGEPLEGRLIRVNNVTLAAPPATFANSTNYVITDGTGSATIRISASTNIGGTAPPAGTFSVVGVLGQFDSAAPFDSGYQLFPRSTADFLAAVLTPASISATAGTPQSTVVNTTFATPLQATVRDGSNALVSNVNVTFTAPASGASGTFAGNATVVTDSNGVATAPAFTANAAAGTYNVTATVNSFTASFSLTNLAPAATHFSISAPASVTSGSSFNVTVTALSASNATVTSYVGTVHFASSSAGTLPSDYTFVGGDNGAHTFSVTLTTTGNQTLDVTDAANGLSGSAPIAVTAPPATHFSVSAPATPTPGAPFNVTVTALDASNATVTGYTGTVHFTSSSAGTLPADYTFVSGDNGTHTFSVTLNSAGTQTVTATDTLTASITGSASTTGACPPVAAPFASNSGPVCAGNSVNLFASGGTSYSWTGPGGFTSSQQNPTGITVAGTYTVLVSSPGACGFSISLPTTVVINPVPVATITNDASVCTFSGGNNASVADAGVGATYLWSITNGSITSGGGTRNIVYTAGASGSVHLAVTVSMNGCGAASSADVAIDNGPSITTQPQNQTIIAGQQATFHVVAAGSNLHYQWFIRHPGGPTSAVGTDLPTLVTGYFGPQAFFVLITNGCGQIDSVDVTITQIPPRHRAASH